MAVAGAADLAAGAAAAAVVVVAEAADIVVADLAAGAAHDQAGMVVAAGYRTHHRCRVRRSDRK